MAESSLPLITPILLAEDYEFLSDYATLTSLQNLAKRLGKLPSCNKFKFKLDDIPREKCYCYFRFEKEDIQKLHKALQLPDKIVTEDNHTMNGIEALCFTLRRFAYPSRLYTFQDEFGLDKSSLGKLSTKVINLIYDKWNVLLQDIGSNGWIDEHFLNECSKVSMCCNCNLLQQMEDYFVKADGSKFCIYGDSGYPLREQLLRPFAGNNISTLQAEWNYQMSSVRQCVEGNFGKVSTLFVFTDFSRLLLI